MATVREHYDEVLSQHYSRMFGEFEAKVAEQQALLERLGITPRQGGGLAVDLGCGSGFQSIALARLGFRVLAIDFSHRLLAELNERVRGLPVAAIAGDIRDVAALAPTAVEVAVCMGDTLSHLECEGDLGRVFAGVAARLVVGGRFVLTFRDLSGELHELDRFIPLCSSDDLIMTCFLEYEYLQRLESRLRRERMSHVRTIRGEPRDPKLPRAAVDVAILAHMYHEIENPYEFLYRLWDSLDAGARVAVVDVDKRTENHGTPPALLRCEMAAVGFRQVDFTVLAPADGYLAVFVPPDALPSIATIRPCPQ